MRTRTHLSFIAGLALIALAGCTVKDVDQPALAGPSTLGRTILLSTDRNTLTQNGSDFVDIRITALGPDGRSESIPLKAQIFVDGVAQDFGTLSTKNPVTPTTIRYTAPPASGNPGSQTPQTVTLVVVPTDSGDFRSEVARQLDLRLEPLGVILPTNPNLAPAFTFTPATPKAGDTVTFDAATTTNNGATCAQACTYVWDFGDGTTGAGITATHVFKTAGNFAVRLSVTDARGAVAQVTRVVPVGSPTPPTASFVVSPTPPAINVDTFFNATATPAPGRTIVSYSWDFGDGSSASGAAVAHKYTGAGTFTVVLTVTDDAGGVARVTQTLTLGTAGPTPVAQLTATPSTAPRNTRIVFDASGSTPSTGSTIVSYRFDYGDGSTPEVVTNPIQSHVYTGAGTFVASVEVTDSNGKTAAKTTTVTITP
jgi:PKD repeat protein